jgi:excisionase family DNA binding protein
MNDMIMMKPMPGRLLKAVEVAEILNISRAFAYKLIQQGKIRSVAIGGARRVRPEDLTDFIEQCLNPPLEQIFTGW